LGEDFEDIETIGGLMLSQLTLPTSVGDTLNVNDVTLRIEEVSGLTIERVSVHFPPDAAQS
jgi:CBS domain containing-hemolysin-like protein